MLSHAVNYFPATAAASFQFPAPFAVETLSLSPTHAVRLHKQLLKLDYYKTNA